jgi:hypothetical protein
MELVDPSRFVEPNRTTSGELEYRRDLEQFFPNSVGSNVEKLQNFTKYVPTQDVRKFICRTELFKKVLNIHGSIIECGVLYGGGLMSWAHLSEIFEPLNHTRKIIGIDTFSGFVSISEKDETGTAYQGKNGGLAIDTFDDLNKCIELYNKTRFLQHIEKVKLIRGDVAETLPKYIAENPHLVVSLLYLDFDIYAPTQVALKYLISRIPKGGVIAFDELNHEVWPGETLAVMEEIGINKLKIERFSYGGTLSYAVIE